MLQVYLSNRLEALFQDFKTNLFSDRRPFSKRIVIVPSPVMKSWMLMQLANDPEVGVATGIDICYLDQAIDKVSDLFGSQKNPEGRLSFLEMSFAIEIEIRKILNHPDSMWKPIFTYLQNQEGTLSIKGEKRLQMLSQQLSSAFMQYGKYGGKMGEDWIEKPKNWQEALWKRLFEKKWSYPYREMTQKNISQELLKRKDVRVDLFALSFLPKLYHQFFSKVSNLFPINYYFLSPCALFWTDLCSDKERYRIQKFWEKKNVSEAQQSSLEQYLRDHNPLLSNFGSLGKEMIQQIEDTSTITHEAFFISNKAVERETYHALQNDELYLIDQTNPLSLLEGIQTDLLLLRNPEKTEKIEVAATDTSLQIHQTSNPFREVEVLYDVLLALFQDHNKNGSSLSPNDILVMAPDIQKYLPFIKTVFESPESQLSPSIMDISSPVLDNSVQCFLDLISLPFTRWESDQLLKIFENPCFQKKMKLNYEDFCFIQKWIREADIRWGIDVPHRNDQLKKEHCEKEMLDQNPSGTWFEAFNHLFYLLTHAKSDNLIEDRNNLHVDITHAELIGSLLALINNLRQDLTPLSNGTSLILSEWISYLQKLYTTYISEVEEENAVFKYLHHLQEAARKLDPVPLPFSSLLSRIEENLKNETFHYREADLDSIRFCSLLPMRAIPARVIVILGMSEGSFPRLEKKMNLNQLFTYSQKDYLPSQTDYDRYLFLETLLSARDHLLIFYSGEMSEALQPAPSLLVSELQEYIEHGFKITGNDDEISPYYIFKHPHKAYDTRYFSTHSQLKSFSKSQFQCAIALNSKEKSVAKHFLDYGITPKKAPIELSRIRLQDLHSCARNPLRSYFQNTLGIYLRKTEEVETDEALYFSPLKQYLLQQKSLNTPILELLSHAEKKGYIPQGPFKSPILDRLKKELLTTKNTLLDLNIKNAFDIVITAHCTKPTRISESEWHVPPLELPIAEKMVSIVGKMTHVTQEGLLLLSKDSKIESIKIWPQYLMLCHLTERYDLNIKPQLIFGKETKEKIKTPFLKNTQKLLTDYLEYYFLALKHPSPLIPEWIIPLLTEDSSSFAQFIQESLNNPFASFNNLYVEWAMRGKVFSNCDEIYQTWQPIVRNLFEDMLLNWYDLKLSCPS